MVLRLVRWLAAAVLLMPVLFVASLALPVTEWRTGRLPVAPLDLMRGDPDARPPARIWIDTDAACGVARADPDDCYAIALLAAAKVEIVGISTVFGNAPVDATDRVTRRLVAALTGASDRAIPVHTGGAQAGESKPETVAALQRALADGPLTILALGPLTNLAAALADRPDLACRLTSLNAGMAGRARIRGSGGLRPMARIVAPLILRKLISDS